MVVQCWPAARRRLVGAAETGHAIAADLVEMLTYADCSRLLAEPPTASPWKTWRVRTTRSAHLSLVITKIHGFPGHGSLACGRPRRGASPRRSR
jgi:hypothetical protein